MKKYFKNISEYIFHFNIGIVELISGFYISSHLNYLDNPAVTPPPPIVGNEHLATGFADDWWFSLAFMVVGALMIAGVLLDIKKLRNAALYISTGIFTSITIAFLLRSAVDGRFNMSWILSLGLVLTCIGVALKGGDSYFR